MVAIAFIQPSDPHLQSGTVAVPILADRTMTASASDLDKATSGSLKRAMESSHFTGKAEQILTINAPTGLTVNRIVLIGLGAKDLTPLCLQQAGGTVINTLMTSGETEVTFLIDDIEDKSLTSSQIAVEMAFGARLGSFRFEKYRTTQKPEQQTSLTTVRFACVESEKATTQFHNRSAVIDGVFRARNVSNEPANVLNPETFAQQCQSLSTLGIDVEILDQERLEQIGMRTLLSVAQGSSNKPYVVVMSYWGASSPSEASANSTTTEATSTPDHQPIALVGKGVTFDTGGISLKPPTRMHEMKMDMSGAAAVFGTMAALAGRKAHVNVIGVIGLVENMISGQSTRPGDVITSLSGKTIENLNTDAEGRLVLADILWYTQDRFKPRIMIDLATLTGAIIVALGHEYAGLFTNDDQLAQQLVDAGQKVGEKAWRMPLGEAYDKELDSEIADMKNIGTNGSAGSTIGAQFVQRFVNEVPWVHLDIAGVAWLPKKTSLIPKHGTGFGVRLLDQWLMDYYETV